MRVCVGARVCVHVYGEMEKGMVFKWLLANTCLRKAPPYSRDVPQKSLSRNMHSTETTYQETVSPRAVVLGPGSKSQS